MDELPEQLPKKRESDCHSLDVQMDHTETVHRLQSQFIREYGIGSERSQGSTEPDLGGPLSFAHHYESSGVRELRRDVSRHHGRRYMSKRRPHPFICIEDQGYASSHQYQSIIPVPLFCENASMHQLRFSPYKRQPAKRIPQWSLQTNQSSFRVTSRNPQYSARTESPV